MVIGLPPVLNFAKPELRDKIVPEIFAGKKVGLCRPFCFHPANADYSSLAWQLAKHLLVPMLLVLSVQPSNPLTDHIGSSTAPKNGLRMPRSPSMFVVLARPSNADLRVATLLLDARLLVASPYSLFPAAKASPQNPSRHLTLLPLELGTSHSIMSRFRQKTCSVPRMEVCW